MPAWLRALDSMQDAIADLATALQGMDLGDSGASEAWDSGQSESDEVIVVEEFPAPRAKAMPPAMPRPPMRRQAAGPREAAPRERAPEMPAVQRAWRQQVFMVDPDAPAQLIVPQGPLLNAHNRCQALAVTKNRRCLLLEHAPGIGLCLRHRRAERAFLADGAVPPGLARPAQPPVDLADVEDRVLEGFVRAARGGQVGPM